ncbi:MAG: hypothetical protein NC319_07210 [Butyricicoccus sp.]|nr:hypothetical protein [Butyricicoccus sp.]
MLLRLIFAFAAAAALMLLLWLLRGVMLTPVRAGANERLSVVITVTGSAPELENTVDALLWLRQNGTLRAQVLVRDAGMEQETRRAAELLERRGAVKLIT